MYGKYVENQSEVNDLFVDGEFKNKDVTAIVKTNMCIKSEEIDITFSDYLENPASCDDDGVLNSEEKYNGNFKNMNVKEEIEYKDVAEIVNANINLKNEEIDIKIDQKVYESCQDVSTSPQLVMRIENLYNHNDHMITDQEGRSEVTAHKCESGSFVRNCKNNLKQHLTIHPNLSNVKLYKCGRCSFATNLKGNLKCHLLVHQNLSEVTTYKCEKCSFVTKRKHSLKRHLLVHRSLLEVKLYKCESCSYVTRHKCHLISHMLIHQNPSEVTTYKCETCLFTTKYKRNLKSHLLIHRSPSEVTSLKCENRPYLTKDICDFKDHLLIHRKTVEGIKSKWLQVMNGQKTLLS